MEYRSWYQAYYLNSRHSIWYTVTSLFSGDKTRVPFLLNALFHKTWSIASKIIMLCYTPAHLHNFKLSDNHNWTTRISWPSHLQRQLVRVRRIHSLRWRHNGHGGVSNHQPHHCLLNGLFGCRSKKTSKLRVTDLCARNSPGTGEFHLQMASNAENVSGLLVENDVINIIFTSDNAQ